MANTIPVAGDVEGETFEDGLISITLTATDLEDGAAAAPTFTLSALPANGTLWVEQPFPPWSAGVPAQAGIAYAPDFYEDYLGAWTETFYFVPTRDWSGAVTFGGQRHAGTRRPRQHDRGDRAERGAARPRRGGVGCRPRRAQWGQRPLYRREPHARP